LYVFSQYGILADNRSAFKMAAEEGQKEEGPVDEVTKKKQTNRFENWLVIYLPLAWLAQLGNGVIQTITGTEQQ
jgi:hypothetical protein